jgi:hypothetical protein
MGWKVSETKAIFDHASHELVVSTRPSLRIEIGRKFEAQGTTTKTPDQAVCSWQIQPREDSVDPSTEAPAPEEAYSRLDDFIVKFPQKYPWPFSYQLDVRVQPNASGLLVAELWLSVQTSMLECNPQLRMTPGSSKEPWTSHPDFLCSSDRRTGLAIHPLDRQDCLVHANRSGEVEQVDLFGRFMEKGVIRRGRLLLVGSATSISEKQMQKLCQDFSSSELPLTP